MSWYDSAWVCQPPIAECIEKENLTGCRTCKGEGSLKGTTPEECLPPECDQGKYYNGDWICVDNPKNCLEAENVTGECQKAKEGYYITSDKTKVESCKTKDENCTSCKNTTGFCLVCSLGKLDSSSGTCIIRSELEGLPKNLAEGALYTMTATTAVLMPLNSSGGVAVIKIIQIFDYLGFIDVEKPRNVDAVFQMFNSNFLSLIPNPFGVEDYNDDYDVWSTNSLPSTRIISDDTLIKDRKCAKNNVMADNEFSCYFLNSSGQHIIHGSIYIFFKCLLIFLIHYLCRKRIRHIEIEMLKDKEN